MLPIIAHNVIESFNILISSVIAITETLDTFKVNHASIKESLDRNPIIITKLNEVIGYDRAAQIVKEAYKTNRPILEVAESMTNLSKAQLQKLLDPKKLV
tara:strand:- start:314 stop:613 length:300 start_codon:yes stop_codon:yes gene_type:complete